MGRVYASGVSPIIHLAVNGQPIGTGTEVTGAWTRHSCFENLQTVVDVTNTDGVPGFDSSLTNVFTFENTLSSVDLGFAQCELTFGPPKDDYVIQIEVSTDPTASYKVEKRVAAGGQVTAELSLGTIFSVHLLKKPARGGGASVAPLASGYGVAGGRIDPSFETERNLFDTNPLVSLSGGVGQGESSEFAAVHMGRADIQMLPLTESNVSSFVVHLRIVPPQGLGGAHNEVDARVVQEAHERGIPPQILKGQIRQEAPTFNGSEFRYEPCSADFANISGGPMLVKAPPFSTFAMDAARADSAMVEIVDLRNQLFIPDPNVPTGVLNITHADANVTAKMIWTASDGSILRPPPRTQQNWSHIDCGARKRWERSHPDSSFVEALDFIAQTTTASSYGWFQALYSTALSYGWSVPDPANPGKTSQNPRYLVDTVENLALRHGGSMFVGGTEDVQRYWDAYDALPTVFATRDEFWDSFKTPLRMYTGGGIREYGENIVDIYQFDYLPTQPSQIFK